MYLISPNKKQYKANLHSHSSVTDGCKTPEELKELYRGQGYDILAITDHEVPKEYTDFNEDDFLMLTGYEAHIRPLPPSNAYAPEIHLNLFARDPKNETHICYHKDYCKYISDERVKEMVHAGTQCPREYTREYINNFIRTANENGYLVSYNHPVWSMETEADIMAYDGYFSLEISNYGSYLANHLEYNGMLYDKMLCAGKRVFCHAGDDNHNRHPVGHPKCDSFGAYTMILADDLTYENVIRAMESGEMYASRGPVFKEVSLEGNKLHIVCSEVASIYVYYGSKSPACEIAEPGQSLTEAEFTVPATAKYVRISVFDREGKSADTRGFFPDELV